VNDYFIFQTYEHAKILTENLEGKHIRENIGIDGRIILKFILKKQGGNYGLDEFCSEYGPETFMNTVMNHPLP
jgi:hypothetical protein